MITELGAYKNKGYYPVAKNVFGNNNIHSFEEFDKFLKGKGFVKLGNGEKGWVYEKPGYPWVFKIFKNDPAYEYYFSYIKKNQMNPSIPKVRGGMVKIVDGVYMVRLEKLTDISDELYDMIYDTIRYMKVYNSYPMFSSMRREINGMVKKLKKSYPGLYKVIIDMMKSGYKLDINPGNIMMRGNVPVLVDAIG